MHLDSINQCSCILLAYMVINVFRVLQSCIKHCHSSLLIFVLMLSPASLHWVPILCWGVLCYHKPHLSPSPLTPPLSLSLASPPDLLFDRSLVPDLCENMGYFTIYVPFLASYSSRPTILLSRAKLFQRAALQE